MNLKEETLELEEMTFRTQQLPAMKAFTLLARLAKAIGPALGALMKLGPEAKLEASETLMSAFSELNPEDATKLVPEILSNTSVVGDDKKERALSKRENIDYVFSGRLMLMFKVMGHALQVNYRDFSPGSESAAPQDPTPTA